MSTPKLDVNPDHVMNRWKAHAKKVKPSDPNYFRLACQSLKMTVRCQQRIMRLAPLLFNNYAIIRQVEKSLLRLQKLRGTRCIPAEPAPCGSVSLSSIERESALVKEIHTQISKQAWNSLSPETLEALKLEWQVYQLANTVMAKAWTQFKDKVDVAEFNFSEYLMLLSLAAEFAKIHFWTVPPQIAQLEQKPATLPELGVQHSCSSGKTTAGPQNQPVTSSKTSPPNASACADNIIHLTTIFSALHEADTQTARASANQPRLAATA